MRTRHPSRKAGLVSLGLVLIVVLALLGYRELYRDRIYPGVEVAGVSLGGMTTDEARSALASHLSSTFQAPLVVEAGDTRWELSRRTLGAHYDLNTLVDAAFAVGRTGTIFSRLGTPAWIRLQPRDLVASIQLGTTDWTDVLGPIEKAVEEPSVDARLVISDDHSVKVMPDKEGARLDVPATQEVISNALISGSDSPLALPIVHVAPAVHAADLVEAQKRASLAVSSPVLVTFDGGSWELSVDAIQSALLLPAGAGSSVRISPSAVNRYVGLVASNVDRPARDALLVLDGDRVVTRPSQTARKLDQAATAALVQSAIFSAQRRVTPVVKETAPAVVESDLASSMSAANALVGSPVELDGPDGHSWTLAPSSLRKMLVLPQDAAAQRDQPPGLSQAKLGAYVADLARQIDRPAFNARFAWQGGQVQLLRDGVAGQTLDQPSTVQAIEQAASGSQRVVTLPVAPVVPAITASDAGKLNGLQLIGDNSTSYAGSIPPRRHNVELATAMLNGVVVAPGQIFSFNRELGPQTLDRGFQVGYGIVAQGNGEVKTVPSVGGGICQVATTLFQPVFWAGYEIEERHWHAYWIAHYASHGLPGLDDTVDDASGLDFQFKNDTPNPLLIQSSTDGTNVHFAIYGVPPTWSVHVDKPVISDLVKTDRTLRVQPDPTLAPGQRIYTEAAEDGFTVVVRRIVDEGNGSVRTLVLRSVYAPSHNVVAVGPSAPPTDKS